MHPRALALVQSLSLKPHPEGGYWGDVFRSSRLVQPLDGPEQRQALTAIYFLLTAGGHSRWHRLRFDEVWSHLEGEPVLLHSFDERTSEHVPTRLGPLVAEARPVHAIAAGVWQAARPLGDYALVSAVVAPGFEFRDFKLAADEPGSAGALRARLPALAHLI